MKILSHDQYRDGGTLVLDTDNGTYLIDYAFNGTSPDGKKATREHAGEISREDGKPIWNIEMDELLNTLEIARGAFMGNIPDIIDKAIALYKRK